MHCRPIRHHAMAGAGVDCAASTWPGGSMAGGASRIECGRRPAHQSSRQHFQQFDFEHQIRIRPICAADLALTVGQVRRHQQLALAADAACPSSPDPSP